MYFFNTSNYGEISIIVQFHDIFNAYNQKALVDSINLDLNKIQCNKKSPWKFMRRMETLRLKRLMRILHSFSFHNLISTLLQAISIPEERTLSFEELNKVRRSFVGGGLFEGGCKSDCKTFFIIVLEE